MILSATLNGLNDLANDIVLMVFLALFTVVAVLVCVWIIAASINKPEKETVGKMKAMGVVWLIVVIGFAIRAAFSLVTVGYLGVNSTNPMVNSDGLSGLYQFLWNSLRIGFTESGFYPVHTYTELFFAKILDIFGVFDERGNVIMRLIFRLPYMLCDAAAAIVLFKIAKKYANSQVGIAFAVIYSLCPVFFFSSGIWGSALSILSLLILLSFYFMTQRKFLFMSISYALALLTTREAVYFLPILAVFYVLSYIKVVKNFRADENRRALSFKQLFLDREHGLIIRLPLYLCASLILMYVFSVPMLKHMNYSFFKWFAFIYVKPFTAIKSFGTNAFSVYNLFGRNNAELSSSAPVWIIGVAFFLIAVAIAYVLYTGKKNRANLVVIAAFVLMTLSIYAMGFSELTMLPVLGILLLGFVLIKDKRILHIFALLSLIIIVNASAVMASAGYFTGADVVDFAQSTGTTMLSKTGFGKAISIICSGVAMLTHLYFTLIILDITMANRRIMFSTANDSFGEAMKNWLARSKK